MARIRTVKPDFFRDEDLQDLEGAHPGHYAMLVFAALWGHCDKAGRFEWKPRSLKLDILPFLDFDMAETLRLLAEVGFIVKYTVDEKDYGFIPTFEKHQRINGKEAQEPERFPAPPVNAKPVKQTGSDGEAAEKQPRRQEGKGREEEEEGKKIHAAAAPCVISPTPMITADMSAEDLFWSMADQAAKAGITRSLMGKLANQADDFDEAYDTLRSAISAREPRRYLGAIIGKRKTEESAQAAAIAGLPSSEPAFVREARRDGLYVERMESGRWRVSGAIYDSGGNEVGW